MEIERSTKFYGFFLSDFFVLLLAVVDRAVFLHAEKIQKPTITNSQLIILRLGRGVLRTLDVDFNRSELLFWTVNRRQT